MTEKTIPILKASRLILRPFNLGDAKEVQRQAGHPDVAATTATIPHPYLDGMAEQWISGHAKGFEAGTGVEWAMTLADSGKLVGCISLMGISKTHQRAEIGYWVGKEFWSQGFCTEATRAVIQFSFEQLNLNKVTSRHMHVNPASGKVMINAGMQQEGVLRKDYFKNGQFADMVVYGILKESYRA
jgi:ribosomal-protein-alanine N-acetyltransferase